MNINFTLFVQIFHFLIAYIFLSKFLFRPILKLFREEKSKLVKLNQNIAIEQEKLNNQELLAEQNWSTCRKHFQENIPHETPTAITKLDTSTIEQPIHLTIQETQQMVKTIASDIKSKVVKND